MGHDIDELIREAVRNNIASGHFVKLPDGRIYVPMTPGRTPENDYRPWGFTTKNFVMCNYYRYTVRFLMWKHRLWMDFVLWANSF